MLNKIIQYSLHNRLVIILASVVLLLWGTYTAYKMEVEQVKNIIPTEDLSKDIAVEKAMGIVRDNAVVKAEEEAPAEAAEEEKSEEA